MDGRILIIRVKVPEREMGHSNGNAETLGSMAMDYSEIELEYIGAEWEKPVERTVLEWLDEWLNEGGQAAEQAEHLIAVHGAPDPRLTASEREQAGRRRMWRMLHGEIPEPRCSCGKDDQ